MDFKPWKLIIIMSLSDSAALIIHCFPKLEHTLEQAIRFGNWQSQMMTIFDSISAVHQQQFENGIGISSLKLN